MASYKNHDLPSKVTTDTHVYFICSESFRVGIEIAYCVTFCCGTKQSVCTESVSN